MLPTRIHSMHWNISLKQTNQTPSTLLFLENIQSPIASRIRVFSDIISPRVKASTLQTKDTHPTPNPRWWLLSILSLWPGSVAYLDIQPTTDISTKMLHLP